MMLLMWVKQCHKPAMTGNGKLIPPINMVMTEDDFGFYTHYSILQPQKTWLWYVMIIWSIMIFTYTYMYIYIRKSIYLSLSLYIYMYTYVYVYTCNHIYIYIYIYSTHIIYQMLYHTWLSYCWYPVDVGPFSDGSRRSALLPRSHAHLQPRLVRRPGERSGYNL